MMQSPKPDVPEMVQVSRSNTLLNTLSRHNSEDAKDGSDKKTPIDVDMKIPDPGSA